MMKPYLSIIVPVYNTEKYLDKCIQSILAQKYENFELILVDDGSTDASLELCECYAQQDERIHVIHKKNGGVTSARKVGVLYSHGQYLSFIDSDDWIESGFYDGIAEYAVSGYDVILMNGYQIDGAKNKRIRTGLKQGDYSKQGIEQILVDGMIPALWLKIFKRELLVNNISLIDNHVWRGEDLLFSYASLLDAQKIMVLNRYKYHYVQRKESAMHQYSDRNIDNLNYFVRNIKKIQKVKRSSFLDATWNRQILMELLEIIRKEFYERDYLLSPTELRALDKKFSKIRFSHLLLGDGLNKVVITKNEMRILGLYSRRSFFLLNIYLRCVDGFYLKKSSENRRERKQSECLKYVMLLRL